MTIEDTIRTEMMRLQQLLGRLEEFKQDYESTVVCLDKDHMWDSRGFTSFHNDVAEEVLTCRICGLKKSRYYKLTREETFDRWSDLREDEEE